MKRYVFFILLSLILSIGCRTEQIRSENYDTILKNIAGFWFHKHNNFSLDNDVWGNYTMNLSFDALLGYDRALGRMQFTNEILDVIRKRGVFPGDTLPYRSQPFCSLEFPLFEATGDSSWLSPFVYETLKMRDEMKRSPEGAVCFYGNSENPESLLIDFIQEYCLRMARAGALTGNEYYFRECVNQFRIHREILRDPVSGLWCQGRGWLDDPEKLSPGAWSRGHGWLLRGMVLSLTHLPKGSVYYFDLREILQELILSLEIVQDKNGMWPVLLNRPMSMTYPETSGSGMIAGYSSIALKEGMIDKKHEKRLKSKINLATQTLSAYVLPDGEISNSCEGPGPLRTEDIYLGSKAFTGNEHGYQAFILAFTGAMILDN